MTKKPVNINELSEASKRSCSLPDFYEDKWYKCIDCGEKSLFLASSQKEWYEVQKRYFYQHPIRCRDCNNLWSETKKSKLNMDNRLVELKINPKNQKLIKECAFAIIAFHKKSNKGNLCKALHLLRSIKAHKKDIEDGILYCGENIKNNT